MTRNASIGANRYVGDTRGVFCNPTMHHFLIELAATQTSGRYSDVV